jgi:hypothetical protein
MEILNVQEMAQLLRTSQTKIRIMARVGEFGSGAFKVGRAWRFIRDEALSHLAGERTNKQNDRWPSRKGINAALDDLEKYCQELDEGDRAILLSRIDRIRLNVLAQMDHIRRGVTIA